MTNTEFIEHLLDFCPQGALSHILILDAIEKHAKRVAEAAPIEHGFINGVAYKQCAAWIVEQFEERRT